MIGFTWRKIYATAIGAGIWWALATIIAFFLGNQHMMQMLQNSEGPGFLIWLVLLLGLFIASIIFAVKMSGKINRIMMAKAVKNQQVIRDFDKGIYDDRIPEKMNTPEGRARLRRYLENGQATSVTRAVWMARKKKVDRAAGLGFLKLNLLALRSLDNMVGETIADCGHAVGGAVNDVVSGIENMGSSAGNQFQPEDNTWKITQAKNKAIFMRTQADNAAMAAPGSYDAHRKDNLAKKQEWDAYHMY